MPSPFPGMDPYLESSDIWPGFHHFLADELAAQLNPLIGPRYYADVEVRTIAEEISIATKRTIYPDSAVLERGDASSGPSGSALPGLAVPAAPVQRAIKLSGQVKLRSVQIHALEDAQLVTAIEILSPFNKRAGGIQEYRRKRSLLLRSAVHLLEIDLLRAGERPGPEIDKPPLETEYILLVNRGQEINAEYRLSEIWPVSLAEALPVLPVPLLPSDPDVSLDLNKALQAVYVRAGYDWRIDYSKPVPPPELRPEMATWLAENLPR